MPETVTTLKLIGFSIEIKEGPVELLMQTDKGPFSVEIPTAQLSKLVYALRFVLYAEEPLKKKRERKLSGTHGLYASAKKPKKPKSKAFRRIQELVRSREDIMFDWPLTPPKQVTLSVSLILAIFACLVQWLHLAVPPLHNGFVILIFGYLVLLAGNVFRDV